MAASFNPNQPQGQVDHPLQAGNDHPPQNSNASSQDPQPAIEEYPPQGYPPQAQADHPPAYATHEPVSPPAYNSEADQLAYNFHPKPSTSTVVVAARAPASVPVATQPTTSATTTRVSPPMEDHSGVAICALVFSIITLITCGASVICLFFSIPALILSIAALRIREWQKNKAGISIILNVAVVVCTVVLLVAVVTPVTVTAGAASTVASRYRYCAPYYSSTYSSYCVPYSYSTNGSCSYYSSSGYCPTTTSTP